MHAGGVRFKVAKIARKLLLDLGQRGRHVEALGWTARVYGQCNQREAQSAGRGENGRSRVSKMYDSARNAEAFARILRERVLSE